MYKLGSYGCETESKRAATMRRDRVEMQRKENAKRDTVAMLHDKVNALTSLVAELVDVQRPAGETPVPAAPKRGRPPKNA